MKIEIEPVYDDQCRFVVYDMFVDGVWHGSRRTWKQCQEYLRGL